MNSTSPFPNLGVSGVLFQFLSAQSISFVDGPNDIIFGTYVVRSLLLITVCPINNTAIGFCFKGIFVQGIQ